MANRLKQHQSSDSQNHGDREIPSDPNAMGPSMRAPYDVTAAYASGFCDMHDSVAEQPYPRVNNGVIGVYRSDRGKK